MRLRAGQKNPKSLRAKIENMVRAGATRQEIYAAFTNENHKTVKYYVSIFTGNPHEESAKSKAFSLYEKGLNPRQVATKLGIRLFTARAYNCRWKKLKGEMNYIIELNVREALEIEAEDRKMTLQQLVHALLTKICEDELFEEILSGKISN